MELGPFDPIDFKKFTDGKTIVKVSAQRSVCYQQLFNIDYDYVGY